MWKRENHTSLARSFHVGAVSNSFRQHSPNYLPESVLFLQGSSRATGKYRLLAANKAAKAVKIGGLLLLDQLVFFATRSKESYILCSVRSMQVMIIGKHEHSRIQARKVSLY